jgi:Lon protease-like protein
MSDKTDEIPLPETVGVIALPGTILFPNALLPLYIFEPCYRDMLASALDDGRIFAVAMQRADDGRAHDVGGAGLVRACVRNPDGTSHLILHGVARIRFTEWLQTEPYRVARIQRLESNHTHDPEAEELAKTVREICRSLTEQGYQLPKHFETFLESAKTPEALSDAVCSTLIPNAESRQALLQELDVVARLEGFLEILKDQLED